MRKIKRKEIKEKKVKGTGLGLRLVEDATGFFPYPLEASSRLRHTPQRLKVSPFNCSFFLVRSFLFSISYGGNPCKA